MQNNLIGDVEERLVRYLSETYPGRIQDTRMCDEEEPGLPSEIGLFQDTGFQGYHPAGVHLDQPQQTPKGQELTPEEKAENKIISRLRSLMEHSIAGVNRWRIVKDVWRNTNLFFTDQVMEMACGLHNFRTTLRYNMLE